MRNIIIWLLVMLMLPSVALAAISGNPGNLNGLNFYTIENYKSINGTDANFDSMNKIINMIGSDLQGAINQCDGTPCTIMLPPEHITISNGVIISKSNIAIRGSGTSTILNMTSLTPSRATFEIYDNDATLYNIEFSDFTLAGSTQQIRVTRKDSDTNKILLDGLRVTNIKSVIIGSGNFLSLGANVYNNSVNHVFIDGNHITHATNAITACGTDYIITNNIIEGLGSGIIAENEGIDVDLSSPQGKRSLISNNIISGFLEDGLDVKANGLIVSNNYLYNIGNDSVGPYFGINAGSCVDCIVTDNIILNVSQFGIRLPISDGIVTGNRITCADSTRDRGIYGTGDSRNIIANNFIEDCYRGINLINNANDNQIFGNYFKNVDTELLDSSDNKIPTKVNYLGVRNTLTFTNATGNPDFIGNVDFIGNTDFTGLTTLTPTTSGITMQINGKGLTNSDLFVVSDSHRTGSQENSASVFKCGRNNADLSGWCVYDAITQPLATGTTHRMLHAGASGTDLFLDVDGDAIALNIDSEATTKTGIQIQNLPSNIAILMTDTDKICLNATCERFLNANELNAPINASNVVNTPAQCSVVNTFTTAFAGATQTCTAINETAFTQMQAQNYYSADGTIGFTGDCLNPSNISVKNGLIVGCS